MSDISTLKKATVPTPLLILLAVVTAGLYLYVWMYRTSQTIEKVTGAKVLSERFLISYLTLGGMGGLVLTLVTNYAPLAVVYPDSVSVYVAFALVISYSMSLAATLLAIAWCFHVRRALRAYTLVQHHFELRMNRVWSVLFIFYHVNYCLNDLPTAKQKHDKKQRSENDTVAY
ncbi:hypothetical protein SAMN04487857_110180 [Pseudomonas sp. ok272]|uniref:DUF4234 domain-containing protein n=1 Tax=unclassified Pseudomonas TaxID=196821 RepID=UPI0008C29588|nr:MULTISPECIES: DUF4234 domain-containing protein [unclassified Pseudomonas]SEN14491.1 hypothetical protein SAMN04487857_110180 [Pseudomonas sp. ok272]SFN06969.1 hypothetical protein SAMN04487858_111181 [Pseudomonas sp. ok602]